MNVRPRHLTGKQREREARNLQGVPCLRLFEWFALKPVVVCVYTSHAFINAFIQSNHQLDVGRCSTSCHVPSLSVASVARVQRSLVSMQQRIECFTRRRAEPPTPDGAAEKARLRDAALAAVGLEWKKRGNKRWVGRPSLQNHWVSALCNAATEDPDFKARLPVVVPPNRRPGQPLRVCEEERADIAMREVKLMEVKREDVSEAFAASKVDSSGTSEDGSKVKKRRRTWL